VYLLFSRGQQLSFQKAAWHPWVAQKQSSSVALQLSSLAAQ